MRKGKASPRRWQPWPPSADPKMHETRKRLLKGLLPLLKHLADAPVTALGAIAHFADAARTPHLRAISF